MSSIQGVLPETPAILRELDFQVLLPQVDSTCGPDVLSCCTHRIYLGPLLMKRLLQGQGNSQPGMFGELPRSNKVLSEPLRLRLSRSIRKLLSSSDSKIDCTLIS